MNQKTKELLEIQKTFSELRPEALDYDFMKSSHVIFLHFQTQPRRSFDLLGLLVRSSSTKPVRQQKPTFIVPFTCNLLGCLQLAIPSNFLLLLIVIEQKDSVLTTACINA
jgi:hypothetical protein